VTVGQFRCFVDATVYVSEAENSGVSPAGCFSLTEGKVAYVSAHNWKIPGFSQEDTHPVVCLGLRDMTAYIMWLTHEYG